MRSGVKNKKIKFRGITFRIWRERVFYHLSWYGETDVQSVPDFSKLVVIAAGEEILQQQLVLGDPKTESFY
jgi:hypothetical protein